MTESITVAIADDQVLFCSGIEMLIRSQEDMNFVGAAYDGEAAVALAGSARPDVLLMDVRMPETDGITATRRILDDPAHRTRVVVLTTHQRDVAVVGALSAGAQGFVMKDSSPGFLLETIRAVHAGRTVVAPATTQALIRDVSEFHSAPRNEEPIRSLSDREREIFFLAARGLSTVEIAEKAFVTESTVKTHVSNILSKLSLASRLQLVALAHKHHLVD